MCERQSEGDKVICSQCSGVFKSKYFYKHQKICQSQKKGVTLKPLDVQSYAHTSNADEYTGDAVWKKVVAKMDHDKYFDIIKSDELIMMIGKHIYSSRKPTKEKDAKIKSRTAMRRLARLVEATKDVDTGADLFKSENFYELEEGILHVCKDEGGKQMKAGLKVAIGSLLRMSAKFVETHYIIMLEKKKKELNICLETEDEKCIKQATIAIQELKEKAEQVERFQKVLNSSYAKMFATAEYQLKETRQRQNRKPLALPSESDLQKLRKYLLDQIADALRDDKVMSKMDYVHLRKVVLTRLTLLNARRGSEPARLLINDFQERGEWIEKEKLNPNDRDMLTKYSITFLMGKGTSLVPLLIPKDCERAMGILVSSTNRMMAGVSLENVFVFAYTQQSTDNTTGYNEIRDICNDLEIPVITATAIRHRSSTIFWSMEGVQEATIDIFMEHMGHAKAIDKNIYAVPPVVQTIQTVVPILEAFDQVGM